MRGDGERCVIAGGGPGGMLLTYLLGSAGVPVTLLEARQDFDRDFRGDSLHPYTLELLDRLGLAESLLTLPHHRARHFRFHTPSGTVTTADYGQLDTRFNYVALMPQARFLDFLAERLSELPHCRLWTGCTVTGLLRDEHDQVRGVQYRDGSGRYELPARLVVGADGRFSRLRRLARLPARSLGASTDLLWFRLPHEPEDPPEAGVELFFGRDHYVALLNGTSGWQVGYSLPNGDYPAARNAGVAPLRAAVAEQVPWLANRLHQLEDFSQTTLLSVDIARVQQWWSPGVLLIGDAAHVISPVGGNGILMAIQDAVTAANHLVPALRSGHYPSDDVLRQVQAQREPAIARVQAQQVRTEQRLERARRSGGPIGPPGWLRPVTTLPGVRRRAARANAYGPRPPVLRAARAEVDEQSGDAS